MVFSSSVRGVLGERDASLGLRAPLSGRRRDGDVHRGASASESRRVDIKVTPGAIRVLPSIEKKYIPQSFLSASGIIDATYGRESAFMSSILNKLTGFTESLFPPIMSCTGTRSSAIFPLGRQTRTARPLRMDWVLRS